LVQAVGVVIADELIERALESDPTGEVATPKGGHTPELLEDSALRPFHD
jgi:hypothetical protein